jgi:hypothetical protein
MFSSFPVKEDDLLENLQRGRGTQVSRDPYSLKNRISGTFGIHFVLVSSSHLGGFAHPEYYK